MFQLFIMQALAPGSLVPNPEISLSKIRPKRNKRLYERFALSHKHLTISSQEEILLIQEVSETGFSAEVSKRAMDRLEINGTYLCRIRYLSEVYETKAMVRWKNSESCFIGFELYEPSLKCKNFFKRLIEPLMIGHSLKKVLHQKNWYQGELETVLKIESVIKGSFESFFLEWQKQAVSWSYEEGLRTATMVKSKSKVLDFIPDWDKKLDAQKVKFAKDILMAFSHPLKEKMLIALE